jgi:integrase
MRSGTSQFLPRRLQKLLGHAEAQMTMRYMKHAAEAFLDTDAAAWQALTVA